MKILLKKQIIPLFCLATTLIFGPAQAQKRGIVTENNKQGVVNDFGEEIIPCKYDLIEMKGGNYYVYKEGKQGINNSYGVEVLPCQFSEINVLKSGSYQARNADTRKWGIVNPYGVTVVPHQYDEIRIEGDKYYVRNGERKGIFNSYGVELAPCHFNEISVLKNKNYILCHADNKKQGVINTYGVTVIPFKYDEIRLEGKNYYVRDGKRNGIYNNYGVEMIPCQFDEITLLKNKQYLVRHAETKYLGVINDYGVEVTPCRYNNITLLKNGQYLVQNAESRKFGVVNANGVEVIPCNYNDISMGGNNYLTRIGEQTAIFDQHGGEINKTGNHKVIYSRPQKGNNRQNTFNKYEQVTTLKNNRYLVKKESKYGIMDDKGKMLISCQYDKLDELKREVKLKDRNSEMTVENTNHSDPFYVAQKEHKYGLLNNRGRVMLDFIYENITLDEQDNIIVQVKGTRKSFKIKDFNK